MVDGARGQRAAVVLGEQQQRALRGEPPAQTGVLQQQGECLSLAIVALHRRCAPAFGQVRIETDLDAALAAKGAECRGQGLAGDGEGMELVFCTAAGSLYCALCHDQWRAEQQARGGQAAKAEMQHESRREAQMRHQHAVVLHTYR